MSLSLRCRALAAGIDFPRLRPVAQLAFVRARLSCAGPALSLRVPPRLSVSLPGIHARPHSTAATVISKSSSQLNKPKAALLYKGPVRNIIFNARIFAFGVLLVHAVVIPWYWPSLQHAPPFVMGAMSTALIPFLTIASVSRSYVTRLWTALSPSTSKASAKQELDQILMFERESMIFGRPTQRIVPLSKLRYKPMWIFRTWAVDGDKWYDPGFSIDPISLQEDPVIKRLHQLIMGQTNVKK
ncbi:hypothetical protein HDU83_004776 [Entophlyctis luteolus]|nr:hypothetical protein HDU83_004776 [Entophlyctis luteolus]